MLIYTGAQVMMGFSIVVCAPFTFRPALLSRKDGTDMNDWTKLIKRHIAVVTGQNIRKVREAKGITIEGLAEKLGMTVAGINAIEKGRRGLYASTLVKLAAAMDVHAHYFFTEPMEPSKYIDLTPEERPPMETLNVSHKMVNVYHEIMNVLSFVLKEITAIQNPYRGWFPSPER
ncbi:MAG: helix-turn-helix domain-containing protein [Defluviitaleaceae bacterium]|nr:helix-turn-helix domain-containing protein [Defluviitaleaceae bacterium]